MNKPQLPEKRAEAEEKAKELELVEMRKRIFINLVKKHVNRPGIDNLLDWLEESDFFTAPASSSYHLAKIGGLCEHSLNVYKNFKRDEYSAKYSEESIVITTLFHDLCKVNFYKLGTKNVKNGNSWEHVPYYFIEEKYPFGGHGDKSVFLIQNFMDLTPEEALAIKHHMGIEKDDFGASARAYNMSVLALYTHIADTYSAFIVENDNDMKGELDVKF